MYVKSFEYDLNKPSTNFTNGQWVTVNSLNFQLYNIDGVVYLVNNKNIVKKLDNVLKLFYSGTILNFATNVKIKRERRRHGYINGVPNICQHTGRLLYGNGQPLRRYKQPMKCKGTRQMFGKPLISLNYTRA